VYLTFVFVRVKLPAFLHVTCIPAFFWSHMNERSSFVVLLFVGLCICNVDVTRKDEIKLPKSESVIVICIDMRFGIGWLVL
jgi:hypothetical protein